MDEFKPQDKLIPDVSDRRSTRSRRGTNGPRFTSLRQYITLGVGIFVLILMILGIGSALKTSSSPEATQQATARDIHLDNVSSPTVADNASSKVMSDTQDNNGVANSSPQLINMSPISNQATEAKLPPTQPGAQQRVELSGSMVDALPTQQEKVDEIVDEVKWNLPTSSATLISSTAIKKEQGMPVNKSPSLLEKHPKKPGKTTIKKETEASSTRPNKTTVHFPHVIRRNSISQNYIESLPGNHYTLQLSGSSRSDTLVAFAKQQGISHYSVYETHRNGKQWFVLISGNYASLEKAKQAVTQLPVDIQAKKPWARPVHQVKQDIKK